MHVGDKCMVTLGSIIDNDIDCDDKAGTLDGKKLDVGEELLLLCVKKFSPAIMKIVDEMMQKEMFDDYPFIAEVAVDHSVSYKEDNITYDFVLEKYPDVDPEDVIFAQDAKIVKAWRSEEFFAMNDAQR